MEWALEWELEPDSDWRSTSLTASCLQIKATSTAVRPLASVPPGSAAPCRMRRRAMAARPKRAATWSGVAPRGPGEGWGVDSRRRVAGIWACGFACGRAFEDAELPAVSISSDRSVAPPSNIRTHCMSPAWHASSRVGSRVGSSSTPGVEGEGEPSPSSAAVTSWHPRLATSLENAASKRGSPITGCGGESMCTGGWCWATSMRQLRKMRVKYCSIDRASHCLRRWRRAMHLDRLHGGRPRAVSPWQPLVGCS